MNRVLSIIIFVSIVSMIYFGLHLYVYKFVSRGLDLAPHARKYFKIFLWISGSSFFLHMFFFRRTHLSLLSDYGHIWLGVIAIAFFVFIVAGLVVKFIPSHIRTVTLIGLGVTALISMISLINGLQKPVVRNITIPVRDLPQELSGFTIVQISDLHLEAQNAKRRIPYLVKTVDALKPDLVAVTGDLIEGKVCKDPEFCAKLKGMKSTYGVVAITGNHEFYAGMHNFMELAEQTDMKVLRNESITIADHLQIIGLDDDEGRRFDGGGPNLEKAMKNCDPEKPMILLYHRPVRFERAVAKGVDLQLSGHTHAGQIPPMDLLVWLYYKYPAGLYEKNGSYIYTSVGTGYWGPPMRFLSRHEITKITLRAHGAPL